jgi:hypothetical protein
MQMAWIESHQNLENHPKRIDLSALMGWDIDSTIGRLHRFWWWCVDYAEDGDLRKHNDARLGGSVGLNGETATAFVQAMVTAGWLDREPYFRVHDWWDYIGRFLQLKYKRTPGKWIRVRNAYIEDTDPSNETVASGRLDEWSDAVRARDNNVCQLCGADKGQMHAHHIKRQSDYPSLTFEVSNGITLCRDCHKGIYGKEITYEEEFTRKVSEKYTESTPNQTKPNHSKPNQLEIVLPKVLDSPEVRSALDRFIRHRREIKKPVTPTSLERILATASKHSASEVIESLDKSVASGWQGIFFDERKNGKNGSPPSPDKARRHE